MHTRRPIIILLFFLLLSSAIFGEFMIENVEVTFHNIQKDGQVSVRESIKFYVIGSYEQQLYKSGFGRNDLSFWATTTNLADVKLHVNPNFIDLRDFRITPQAMRNCDAFLRLCHGEIILEYVAMPYANRTSGALITDTGIFKMESYKPRTVRYTLNPNVLAFTTTEYGDTILEKYVTLIIELPRNSVVYRINPAPENYQSGMTRLSWKDILLGRITLVFDVEDSISREVTEFFSNFFRVVENALRGPEGLAIIFITIILLASYLYLKSVKGAKKRE